MHEEVLNPQQLKLKSLLQKLSSDFALIGGTAIALQLGHRQSIDFDLVSMATNSTKSSSASNLIILKI